MNYNEKTCFIVTPIGGDNTDVRRSAEGAIDAVIIPLLTKLGFDRENINVAHRMSQSGSINKQLITRILEDDLVIVNLTELNPNVMYELAVRHAVRKPVVQICEHGTNLPFDITDERTIFYTNDMTGVLELKKNLLPLIKTALEEEEIDNPIYRAITSSTILKDVKVTESEKYLVERLDLLEERLANTINESRYNKNYVFNNFTNGKMYKYLYNFETNKEFNPTRLEARLQDKNEMIKSVRINNITKDLYRMVINTYSDISPSILKSLVENTLGMELQWVERKAGEKLF
ncbi:hypothetical protein [Bacillus amyloliquefaciens]|uniref:hypothetical protein n=1 Tax=Bacillus amyloliquefaciens TaxID=1390 RepID=UPI0022371FB1|nr:hypothetical protein [Bacillus amyloliquefaciens]MCW5193139.1 hypothetical protein [Bacillus amyloliquefaciens]